jgi:hypothetical protein
MTNEDYRDLLLATRKQVYECGFSALDERITSNMRGSEGPLWDLLFYLKHLRGEIRLESDVHYQETLQRVRQHVETESGAQVEGIRIDFSPEEAQQYDMRYLVITPSRELGEIGEELGELIEALRRDHDRNSETGGAQ